MATELWGTFGSDVGVTLTPAGEGRLELYLDGETLLDRKAEGGKYPGLDRLREIKNTIREKVQAAGAKA